MASVFLAFNRLDEAHLRWSSILDFTDMTRDLICIPFPATPRSVYDQMYGHLGLILLKSTAGTLQVRSRRLARAWDTSYMAVPVGEKEPGLDSYSGSGPGGREGSLIEL